MRDVLVHAITLAHMVHVCSGGEQSVWDTRERGHVQHVPACVLAPGLPPLQYHPGGGCPLRWARDASLPALRHQAVGMERAHQLGCPAEHVVLHSDRHRCAAHAHHK